MRDRGTGNMSLYIYNTLTGKKEKFVPLNPPKVGIYFCGMTVQGPPHLGHLRAALTGDIIRRYLTYLGYQVTYVQNFTDVEDKVIAKAREEGVDYLEIAERNIKEYYRYTGMLGIEKPDFDPRPTKNIKEIIELIQGLVDKGLAYQAKSGVYYRVEKFKNYGRLSHRDPSELMAGARVEVSEDKESPLDFVLWKAAKPGEPSWPSPWGPGRPGWHIECSAMAMKYLGMTIDIHGGGRDLIFPHHENEIAQSEGLTGCTFARYWVHNGLVNLTGAKMSKSTGQYTLAADLFRDFEPEVVRLYLMMSHYRHPIEFDPQKLAEVNGPYRKLVNLVREAEWLGKRWALDAEGVRPGDSGSALRAEFEAAMNDDFNTASALGVIFNRVGELFATRDELVHSGTAGPAERGAFLVEVRLVLELLGVLGLEIKKPDVLPDPVASRLSDYRDRLLAELPDISAEHPGLVSGSPEEMEPGQFLSWLIELRNGARRAKLWDLADRIRRDLGEMGIVLEDRPEGTLFKVSTG